MTARYIFNDRIANAILSRRHRISEAYSVLVIKMENK